MMSEKSRPTWEAKPDLIWLILATSTWIWHQRKQSFTYILKDIWKSLSCTVISLFQSTGHLFCVYMHYTQLAIFDFHLIVANFTTFNCDNILGQIEFWPRVVFSLWVMRQWKKEKKIASSSHLVVSNLHIRLTRLCIWLQLAQERFRPKLLV